MKRRKVKTPDHWPSPAFHGKWDFIVGKRRKAKKATTDDPFTRYLNDPKLIKALNAAAIKEAIAGLEYWKQLLKPSKFPKLDE